ncbi:MAG: class II aldolase/adducin family protein [Chitinispirillales bacterium]|jgi:ribulose-5-phosphate 4-epimerase/fuculose-1-phosphate aldolase|nr:class II aldolase/adducin family protein [Chitinispirillales bacterium]
MDEGYIKYQAEHEQTNNFKLSQNYVFLAQELIKTRDYLHSLGLIGVYSNGIGFGNCSFRTKENEFVITGSATGEIKNMSLCHLCIVKNFDINKNKVYSKGAISASSESMTHGAVYSAQSAANCVLHIHSKKMFDFMKTNNHNFTEQSILYGTPAMAKAVMGEVKKINSPYGIIVMLGHEEGVISFGEDISSALAQITSVYELSC